MSSAGSDRISIEAASVLAGIGSRIRAARLGRKLTLEAIAVASGMSASMVSLLERGRASPSIGTLVAIAGALGLSVSDLITDPGSEQSKVVVRNSDHRIVRTARDVVRRILTEDRRRGVSIAINEYPPDTGSSTLPLSHGGYEYGFVLEGELNIELDGVSYLLEPGELASFDSKRQHRIWNQATRKARSLWINLEYG